MTDHPYSTGLPGNPAVQNGQDSNVPFPAISETMFGGNLIKTVDGREVHRFLAVGKDYTTWMKDRIKKYGFIEGVDFVSISQSPISGSGNRGAKDEYFLTLSMGKELGMVDRSEKGRQIRKYFISVEEQSTTQMTPAEMFLHSAQTMVAIEQRQAANDRAISVIDERINIIEQLAPLKAKPQAAETRSEIRKRMNQQYALSQPMVDAILDNLPYSFGPFGMVKNSHEDAKGSSFPVYWIRDITKLFKRFVGECERNSTTTYKHPSIARPFKMMKPEEK